MSYYVNPHGHSCPWYPYSELFGAPNVKWCEETLCHWVSEPANTWSNIGYLLVAFYILWSASKTKQKELMWLAPAMFLMGLFSLVYHMSNNYLTQVFDFIGMFLFVFWLFILNLRRLDWVKAKNQVAVFIALSSISTIAVHLMYLTHIKFQIIVAFAAIAIAGTEFLCYQRRLKPIKYKAFITAIVLLVIAESFSIMDGLRVSWICDPTNHWFQGHALWHVLSTIGLVFAYKHYEQFKFSDGCGKDDGQLEFEIDDDIETQLEV